MVDIAAAAWVATLALHFWLAFERRKPLSVRFPLFFLMTEDRQLPHLLMFPIREQLPSLRRLHQ